MDYATFVPEIVTGVILMGFAWAFRSWATTVSSASEKIIARLDRLAMEFHDHRIDTENRVTKVETKHESLQRQVDRITAATGGNGKPKAVVKE